MPEPQFTILDEESMRDPEVLLEVIADLLQHARITATALAMTSALLLSHLGKYAGPADIDAVEHLLREYINRVSAESHIGVMADQLRDFLEARE